MLHFAYTFKIMVKQIFVTTEKTYGGGLLTYTHKALF